MAYVTGVANSLADLLAAIQNACTSNGWSLAGSVLYKGTCYVELKISGSTITIRGGAGIDADNNLTGATTQPPGALCVPLPILGRNAGLPAPSPTYPLIWFMHINAAPDEIYCVINYATMFYQTIGWGRSAMPGLKGSGNWYSGCYGINAYYEIGPTGASAPGAASTFALFFTGTGASRDGFGVDHQLDSNTWAIEGAWRDWASMVARQPNQWNGESVLIPIRVYATRPSGFVSPVLECAHARFVSIASLADQQIITLGSDRWKVYPWLARGNADAGVNNAGTYSGVFGHAFRYDGP